MLKRTLIGIVGTMLPIIVFGLLYDLMNLWPSCNMPYVDVRELYETEKTLFGITTVAGRLTPGEWFLQHTHPVADFYAGFSYLCWVPLPVIFALYLYFRGEQRLAFRFMASFLTVNLVGFAGYYIHPAAPPWYVMEHGFDVVKNTCGSAAGLIRFDHLLGLPIFQSIYTGNSNVFAAVPSLHSAYIPITLFYALKSQHARYWLPLIVVVMFGIWFAAVYTAHHYVIDVTLGILTAIIGITIFELSFRTLSGQRLFNRYCRCFNLA